MLIFWQDFKTNVIQHADKRKMVFPAEEGIDQRLKGKRVPPSACPRYRVYLGSGG